MSVIEFIARVAWPVVILIVALIYRKPLTDLIAGGVTRFRAGPFELAWDQAKSGVERSRQIPPSVSPSDRTTSPAQPYVALLGGELSALAESNPREAVLRAYAAVRQALRAGLEEVGIDLDDADSLDALGLVRIAETRKIVPPEVTDAVLGLNVLYNLAKHAPEREMSPVRAYEYLAMADGALYAFAAARKRNSAASLAAVA